MTQDTSLAPRYSEEEVTHLWNLSWEELSKRAHHVHETYAQAGVQKCQLLSIKTGGCPEDCGYCSQSAHYKTGLERDTFLDVESVRREAQVAKARGASRFCMGAAWRSLPEQKLDQLCALVKTVAEEGLEVCCTLGMATEEQLRVLKAAGLHAYNHNLDTSRRYYPSVVTTRTYDDRLATLRAAHKAGVSVCSGVILGLGETEQDRSEVLRELANLKPQPESVPINLLVPIEGTPLARQAKTVPAEEILRAIAVARILMPQTRIRLSAGRRSLSQDVQRQCFWVGANSVFLGERLLTTQNVPVEEDALFLKDFQQQPSPAPYGENSRL